MRQSEAALAAELETMTRLHAFSTAAMDTRNVGDVLDLALSTLVRVHGADMGTIQLCDPETTVLRLATHRGLEPEFLEHFAELGASERSACARALAQRERVLLEDVELENADDSYRDIARRAGYRAIQSTPLMSAAGRPLGVVSTYFREPRKLSDAECRLTDIFANELSSAMERLGAEQALRESEKTLRRNQVWLAAQKEAFQHAMNGAPLETSLGVLARAAVEQSDKESRCAFYLADGAGSALSHVVGVPESYAHRVDGFTLSPESVACGVAVATGEPVITRDVLEEPRWRPWVALAHDYNYRGCWSFPVETSTGRLVGSFAMYYADPHEPTARDLELAATLSKTAAIIISRHHQTLQRAAVESREP